MRQFVGRATKTAFDRLRIIGQSTSFIFRRTDHVSVPSASAQKINNNKKNEIFNLQLRSGLDSSSSAYCVRMLHNLSREGRTIICTIHQPSAAIYEMFDQVYVLAQGQCVYKGAAANTLSYLGENGLQCPLYHSMADFCKLCPKFVQQRHIITWTLYIICSNWSGKRWLWWFRTTIVDGSKSVDHLSDTKIDSRRFGRSNAGDQSEHAWLHRCSTIEKTIVDWWQGNNHSSIWMVEILDFSTSMSCALLSRLGMWFSIRRACH